MTPEEKLHHLKEWMSLWISCRMSTLMAKRRAFEIYEETGNLLWLSKGSSIEVIPFEEYIKLMENIKSK